MSNVKDKLNQIEKSFKSSEKVAEILIKDKVKVSENFKKDIQSIKYLIQNSLEEIKRNLRVEDFKIENKNKCKW